ncbi:hypothetical protein PMIN04_011859 [Paraphaeosphaeria minitans]
MIKRKTKAKKSAECHPQPVLKTSPYARQPVTLRIGAELRPYYVSKDLLQNPDWIASCCSWMPTTTIDLPELDEDIGHTLVHYLYTGTYETLGTSTTLLDHSNCTEFKRAVAVCDAAQTYHLPGLQKLAAKEADRLGTHLDIFEAMDTVGQNLKNSPKDIIWLSDYLKMKIEAAFRNDHAAFAKRPLLDRSSNSDLNSFLAQCVIDLCSNEISALVAAKHETRQVSPELFAPDAKEETTHADSRDDVITTKDWDSTNNNVPAEEIASDVVPLSVEHFTEEPSSSFPSGSGCFTPASSLVADSGFEMISSIADDFARSITCSSRTEHLLDNSWKQCS